MIVTAQSEPVLSASGAPLAAPVHAVQGVPVDGLIAASDRLEGWWTLRYGGWTLLTPVAAASTCPNSSAPASCVCCATAARAVAVRAGGMRQHTKMRTLNVAICRLRRRWAMPATSCRCIPCTASATSSWASSGNSPNPDRPEGARARGPPLTSRRPPDRTLFLWRTPLHIVWRVWRPLLRNHAKSPRKPLDRLITELHYWAIQAPAPARILHWPWLHAGA